MTYGGYSIDPISGTSISGRYRYTEPGNFGNWQHGVCGLTPGFWSQHLWAWDGNENTDGQVDGQGKTLASKLVAQKVLTKEDVLIAPQDTNLSGLAGVLVGDVNCNGTTDAGDGEITIFFKFDDAKRLINASSNLINADQRIKMSRDAIATQLNLLNGATSNSAVRDLLTGATRWLTSKDPYNSFGTPGVTGNVDQGGGGLMAGDGIADVRYTKSGSFDGFYGNNVKANSPAWQQEKTYKTQNLSGSEIHEMLDDFNNCFLATGLNKVTGQGLVVALAGDGNDANLQDDRSIGYGSLTNFAQFVGVANLV